MQDPHWNARPPHLQFGEKGSHWVAYNGGVGAAQLAWLHASLADARAAGRRVLLVAHCPIHPKTIGKKGASLVWNYEAVLAAVAAFPGVVTATFAGALSSHELQDFLQ